jgi:AraC-like DNA-binding protein
MSALRSELATGIQQFTRGDGLHESPITGVHCVRYSHPDRRTKRQWRACLAIVAQGSKEVVLGREVYLCDELQYTAAPVHLPVTSRIASAGPNRPFLALLIDLDPAILNEVACQLEQTEVPLDQTPIRAFFKGRANDELLEAAVRLTKLFTKRDDARVLGPLVVKEIFFHLLKGPEGVAIRQFARSGSKMHRISQVIFKIRSDLGIDVNVAALAKAAGMSRSALFQYFRDVTSMSPIQYQKRLRLLEARRLLIETDDTAEGSAFKVGYKSSSQFSREYSRMFGLSPVRDATKMKKLGPSAFQSRQLTHIESQSESL